MVRDIGERGLRGVRCEACELVAQRGLQQRVVAAGARVDRRFERGVDGRAGSCGERR